MSIINFIVSLYTKHLNKIVLKFSKIYHFDMGTDGRTSYNNEGDAFKHCFMQAELTLWLGDKIAEYIGIEHEDNNPYNNEKERNMDLWNNREGRKIGNELRKTKWYLDIQNTYYSLAEKIIGKMYNNELITDPEDSRKFTDQ